MPAPRCTHIALHVRDLAACIDFYRRFCALEIVHDRDDGHGGRVVWLAEPGRAAEFAFVLLPGGEERVRSDRDYGHIGFACACREDVGALAERARREGRLLWEPRDEPYPVAHYCGVVDPNGTVVEFSFGQPLGAGAATQGREGRANQLSKRTP